MSISKQEEAIFNQWKAHRPRFVADGVVDENAYIESDQRILFVLKEVNDLNGGGWDLRGFMREGGRPQTWNNIARWIEGIRRLPEEVPWAELVHMPVERRKAALCTVAAINLKKSPGGHTTDSAELARVAAEDKDYLNKQFSLYEADIVVCCGTHVTHTFHWLVELLQKPMWQVTSRGIEYHEYMPGKYLFAYSHPEARVADSLLYYGLVEAVREIRGQQTNNSQQARRP